MHEAPMINPKAPVSPRVVAIGLALVVLVGAGLLYVTRPTDEVSVDLHAAWTPQRDVTVHWQIGPLISGESFSAEDVGQFNLTLNVARGTELVILAEQHGQEGVLECQITAGDQVPVLMISLDGEDCRVGTIA